MGYFTLLYLFDNRSSPITVCSNLENNLSRNHFFFFIKHHLINIRNSYTSSSRNAAVSLWCSNLFNHIHHRHKRYSFITPHSLSVNNRCVPCFQIVCINILSPPLCQLGSFAALLPRVVLWSSTGSKPEKDSGSLSQQHDRYDCTHHYQHHLASTRHVACLQRQKYLSLSIEG